MELSKMRTYIGMEKRRFLLHRRGLKAVELIQTVLKKEKIRFFFDMGTLLGIIRENRILSHDYDFDVAVYVKTEDEKENLKTILQNCGCRWIYCFYAEGIGLIEYSFMYRGVKFDIHYYDEIDGSDICYLYYREPGKQYPGETGDVVMLKCDHIEEICEHDFRGIKVNIPVDPERYLSQRYGLNWKIPDKHYIYWKGPSAVKIGAKGHRKIYGQVN